MKEELFRQLVLQAFGDQHEILLFEDGCLEKFAELVIKKCAFICDENAETYQYSYTPAKAALAKSTSEHCSYLIKQHFGVKE